MKDKYRSALISIIIPAKNEASSLALLFPELKDYYPDAEIIVVDDGSNDDTVSVCVSENIKCIRHPYCKGNGAAIKTGSRSASGSILLFMDADGQHKPADIQLLLNKIEEGYDMAVGQRDPSAQANLGRGLANGFYNQFASLITGHPIKDLTSGFRAIVADKFREFIYLLPNGFSYPSTITMAFFRAGYSVAYVPVKVEQRKGESHLRPSRDGVRFLLIIFRIGTLYSPLKIFAPSSLLFFLLGCIHYGYTYIIYNRFTNMSALLFITSLLVFLIGLVSEQVTTLLYSRESVSKDNDNEQTD